MKKLFAQIVKFGIVGFISFGIDYVTGLIVLNLVMALTSSSYFEAASLIGFRCQDLPYRSLQITF